MIENIAVSCQKQPNTCHNQPKHSSLFEVLAKRVKKLLRQ